MKNMDHGGGHIRALLLFALVVALLVVGLGIWYKMFRRQPQPAWITADHRSTWLYGSVGAEDTAGIPYWIWLALPRIFPEYTPGPGGYAALGFPWEETREMPAGFSKKTVGYVRVAGNCATCHASSQPNGPDEAPSVIAAGPAHTDRIERLQHFYRQCAEDPRFTPNDLLDEIDMATKLSLLDRLLYRYVLIPRTRRQLLRESSVMLDPALLHHLQNPHADPALRQQMEALQPSLQGHEGEVLSSYLHTSP